MRITVQTTDTQTGEGQHGPWTKYAIQDNDGKWYSAFNFKKVFGGLAWEAIQPNTLLDIKYSTTPDGKYNNLETVTKANGRSEEPDDLFDEEFDEPPVNDKAFPGNTAPALPPPSAPPTANMADRIQDGMEHTEHIIKQMKLTKSKLSPDAILRAVVDLAIRR